MWHFHDVCQNKMNKYLLRSFTLGVIALSPITPQNHQHIQSVSALQPISLLLAWALVNRLQPTSLITLYCVRLLRVIQAEKKSWFSPRFVMLRVPRVHISVRAVLCGSLSVLEDFCVFEGNTGSVMMQKFFCFLGGLPCNLGWPDILVYLIFNPLSLFLIKKVSKNIICPNLTKGLFLGVPFFFDQNNTVCLKITHLLIHVNDNYKE